MLNNTLSFITKSLEINTPPRVGLVLGSGLSQFAENLKNSPTTKIIKYSAIPGFPISSVEGHKGELISALINNVPIIAMNGRVHSYEGYDPQSVVMPIRAMGLLGIKNLILTNASGAIAHDFEPGQLMIIKDHLNLTGSSPLIGPNIAELGPRFLDMSYAYDHELRAMAKKAALEVGITAHEGVYASLLGPCYETPAEIRMLKIIGADAVGMSTVFETIAARHMGIKVLGISCLTNKAAGLSDQKITHEEVMENNAKVCDKLGQILVKVISSF
jgi:purine-nucleoside phosphorylase